MVGAPFLPSSVVLFLLTSVQNHFPVLIGLFLNVSGPQKDPEPGVQRDLPVRRPAE